MYTKEVNTVPYNLEKWANRLASRSDISGYVFHMTKANEELNAFEVLIKILKERTLIGSSTQKGFITGDRKAVCFQDTPISSIVENIHHEELYRDDLGGKTRYTYYGICIPKSYLFKQGGRPVFYEQKEIAKQLLPKEEYWRIVDYNLSDIDNIIDWTHEREWRLPTDRFEFGFSKVVILIPNGDSFKGLINHLPKEDLETIRGVIQISPLVH